MRIIARGESRGSTVSCILLRTNPFSEVMLDSRIDKVGLVVVLISACCWIVYCTGFIIRLRQGEYEDAAGEREDDVLSLPYFCQWSFAVCGVLLYLTSFVHLLCGWYPCTSTLLTLVVPVYYVVGGGVLNSDGIDIYTYYTRANVEINFDGYLLVEFSGALGALSFYWVYTAIWILSLQYQARLKRTQYQIIN